MSYEQYMRTLWPKSIKIWWFNRALCSLICLSALRDLSLLKDSDFIGIFYCFLNFGTILIIIKRFWFFYCFSNFGTILIILFFPDGPLESQISETASHSATKLNSYIDPYLTQCSARFGVDPDYHSGSRAKSAFTDSLHNLQNLSSDLQLQYL